MQLKGAVAVITGGANGIGEAVAKELAKEGVKIVIGDMSQENIDRVVKEIKSAGGEAVGVFGNVTVDADVAKLMDTAVSTFGKINIVVPSAGIIKDGLFVTPDKANPKKVAKFMTTDQFKAVIDVNLTGSFITLREAAIRIIEGGWDAVLFTVSSINKEGAPGQLNYSSTKAAVALWPKILIGEFVMKGIKNIRVVGIAPGYVGTPMVKNMNQDALKKVMEGVHLGRLIEPEEIAGAIKHVIQNDAINATTIEVTGGLLTGNIAK